MIKVWLYILSGILTSFSLHATVITFDEFDIDGIDIPSIGNSYEMDGYVFTALDTNYSLGGFRYIENDNPNFQGAAGIFHSSVSGITQLRAASGELFSIQSIDLASGIFNNFDFDLPVSFKALNSENKFVYQTFFVDPLLNTHFTFQFSSDFNNVYHVEWEQGAFFHSFRNVNVTNQVPEPSTFILLTIAILVLQLQKSKKSIKVYAE